MHAGRFDVANAVESMHLAADWAMELKGTTIPSTADHLHYTVREPFGVVGRVIAYNHPLMFATRAARPLIAATRASSRRRPGAASALRRGSWPPRCCRPAC